MKLLKIEEVQSELLELMKKVHTFLEKHQLKYYLLGGSALGAVRHGGFIPWDDDIDIGMFRDDYEAFLTLASEFDKDYDIENFYNFKNCDYALTRIYIKNTFIDNKSISKTKLDKRLYFDIFPIDNVPDDVESRDAFEKKIIKRKNLLQYMYVRKFGNSKIKTVTKTVISFLLAPFRKNILHSFDKLLKTYSKADTEYVCSLCSQYSFKKQVMLRTVYGMPVLHKFEDTELYIPENVDLYLTTLFGEDYMEVPPVEKRRKGYNIYLNDEE